MQLRIGFAVSGFGRAAIHTIQFLRRFRTHTEFFVMLGPTAEPSLESLFDSLRIETVQISHIRAQIPTELENVMVAQHPCDFWMLTFRHLIPTVVVDQLRHRIINLHPTLLPSFGGLHGFDNQKRSHSVIQGATCHFVDEGIDTGPIVSAFVMPRNPGLEWHASEAGFAKGVNLLHTQTAIWMADRRVVSESSRPRVENASYESLPFVPSLDEPELVALVGHEP
jgi:folate-dependent phosphoribosylglycinamide formyltransferase PurN